MADNDKTILVVEDDNDIRHTICTMLAALGFKTVDFQNAKSALDGLKNKPINLALLDIMMPEMSGYELMMALRKLPGYETLPVIMVTAKDQDSEILQGYQHGADYYIPKPFTTKQLEYGIRIFLG